MTEADTRTPIAIPKHIQMFVKYETVLNNAIADFFNENEIYTIALA